MDGRARRGLDEISACHRQLKCDLPNARHTYKSVLVERKVGLLEWSADSDTNTVSDVVDSSFIRTGCIYAQTIRYTPVPK